MDRTLLFVTVATFIATATPPASPQPPSNRGRAAPANYAGLYRNKPPKRSVGMKNGNLIALLIFLALAAVSIVAARAIWEYIVRNGE